MIALGKLKILASLQKLPKHMGDSGKLIVAAGFEIVAQSPINCPIWSHCLQTCKNLGLLAQIL